MARRLTHLTFLILVIGPLLGCSESTSEPGEAGASSPGSAGSIERPSERFQAPKGVDPQVFQDVIEAAFVVPGDSQLRSLRVGNFVQGQVNKACGVAPPPLDATDDRLAQDEFPILSLIAEKGFTEEEAASHRGSNCDLTDARWPEYEEYRSLLFVWLDMSRTVLQEADVDTLKPSMHECLQEASGLRVGDDVPGAFLGAVDLARLDGASDAETAQWAKDYARCTAPYFNDVRDRLLDLRPEMVEKNRELLATVARSMVDRGYVP